MITSSTIPKQVVADEIFKLTDGRGVDVVYDSTNSPSSYQQSSAVIASGGEYIRLGTAMQLKQFGVPDLSSVAEARGAKMIIGDLGRSADPEQAVRRAEEGKLKAEITKIVPLIPWPCSKPSRLFPGARSTWARSLSGALNKDRKPGDRLDGRAPGTACYFVSMDNSSISKIRTAFGAIVLPAPF